MDCVELFSGRAALSEGLSRKGLRAVAYDISYDRSMDMTSAAGFWSEAQGVATLSVQMAACAHL